MPQRNKDSRPVAVLGIGRFGLRIAKNLARGGEEVIACDSNRDAVESIADSVAQAIVLDITDEQAMRNRGLDRAKVAVIGISEDFESAVLVTIILKHLGIPRIIARARTRTTAEVLQRVGADEVVLAEDEAADRWANRILGPHVLNQIEFHDGYSIAEFTAPASWVGKGLAELDIRRKHRLHVIAVRRPDEESETGTRIDIIPPDEPLKDTDVLIVLARDECIADLDSII